MFEFVIAFLKGLLVPLNSTAPTAEQIQAHDDAEDRLGCYGQYPSPMEAHLDAVEWRDGMLGLPLWVLLRWRLAVAWMPFCRGETRLVGERLSRWLMPDLWAQEHRKMRAERIERQRVKAERAEMLADLARIKIDKEGF